MIETQDLTRTFGGTTAVDRLTLTIAEGEVFGLLGPNGAGKTTTVRMLSGLIGRTSGDATVAGFRLSDPDDARKLRGAIGLLPEEPGLYPDLSAARTLDFYGRLYQVPAALRADRTEKLLTLLGLWDRRDAPARTFSKGMRQRLAIARALIHDPPVLFLDEPTANLDPEGARTVRDFLLELRRERRTILLSTHLLDEADRICDRVGVLHTRLLAAGPPSELRAGRPGHVTRVQLAELTDAVVTAARAVAAGPVEVTSGATSSATGGPAGGPAGGTVAVPVGDPGRDNPALVAAIVAAGGRIRFVTEATTSLEEAYLTLLGGAGSTEPRVTQLEGTQLEGTQLEGTKPGGPQ
jgi:ABC-2 type transport system ATP-binding protein